MQYKIFKNYRDVAIMLLVVLVMALCLTPRISLSYASEINKVEGTSIQTSERVSQIRSTKNTDISKRTGKIFYVSSSGDDNNDGLTRETAWKTIDKINASLNQGIVNKTDSILLNRGDVFRGSININCHDILIGSYGNENLPKPEILASPFNGALVGEWTQVEENIWKYTINNQNPLTSDVGVIWFHSNNKNLSNKMENVDGSFEFGKKITTRQNVDERALDIKSLLDEDLEFYHMGHADSRNHTGKELYVYSKENPKDRFDRIEFAVANHGINVGYSTNVIIDNITIKYAGMHGISAGTVANLKVTNSEFGFIGGSTQSYGLDGNYGPVRFGNAVEIYGAVTSQDGYEVEDGFVVQNNYIYQVYDAGITFQYTTENISKIENVIFNKNVVEYCNYSIEYWNKTDSQNTIDQENTYINNYEITNNIMRYSGIGVSETRPDKNQSAHIKTWVNYGDSYNRVKGKYIISNNIFDTSIEQVFWIHAGLRDSLPKVINNKFYNSYKVQFGYYYANQEKFVIPFVQNKLEKVLPNNTFYYIENDLDSYSGSGTTGEVAWNYDNSTGILSITGNGKMQDYSITELPEWYKSRMFIKKIIIDENITHIGKYAFYDLPYVEEIEINCKELDNFSNSGINIGDNYTFYKTGSDWHGIDVTFGENVTVIPAFMFWPASEGYESPSIKSLNFLGNKIKEIKNHAFQSLKAPIVVIPEGVETIESLAVSNSSYTVAISVPDSVKRIDSWAFMGNTKLEKIVFGKKVNKINEYFLSSSKLLKEAIFKSDIEFTSNNYESLFSTESKDTTIFGNDSIRKIVNDFSISTNTSNIKYQNIDEYKINISSNSELIELEHQTDNSILLTPKDGYKIDNLNIYQKFKALDGQVYTISKMNISSIDNKYIIPKSLWDIDIDVTVSKMETKPEEDNKNEDDNDDSKNPIEENKPTTEEIENKKDNITSNKNNKNNFDDKNDSNNQHDSTSNSNESNNTNSNNDFENSTGDNNTKNDNSYDKDQTKNNDNSISNVNNIITVFVIFAGVILLIIVIFKCYKTKF